MGSKIPATIVTGFLGAGKTTMIRHMLNNSGGRRIALVINEFGDLGVDGEILRGCGISDCEEQGIVELSNGCICCTVAEEFLPAMKLLIDHESKPDHIVIETSGLAIPQPLVRAFDWPDIRTRVTVDGVIAVVDGPAFADGRFAHDSEAVNAQRQQDDNLDHDSPLAELFEDQLACADMVIVNKSDILGQGPAQSLCQELRIRAGESVTVIPASNGRVDLAALIGLGMEAERDIERRTEIHHVHGEDGGEHEHDEFESFVLELPEVRNQQQFLEAVKESMASHNLLRVKGFASVHGKPMRLVVQGVGRRVDSYFDRPPGGKKEYGTRLVVIAESGVDRSSVERSFGEI